jgi:cobyrinic acid a,c-diamide synthase
MPPEISYFGGLPRATQFTLPERHLGLVQAAEISDLESRLAASSSSIALTSLAELPPFVDFSCAQAEPSLRLLSGIRIGIAHDQAFSFIYPANLDALRALGAELVFFSPLADQVLPAVDSLYLPGGYPELHLRQLQDNASMKVALHSHFQQGKPIYAECGGMLYLFESLTDKSGQRGMMTGLFPGHAVMQTRLQGLGYQSAPMPGGMLRSHTFHHSVIDTPLTPIATGERLYNTSRGERIFQTKRLIASYLHCYFSSNPTAAARLFLP